MKLNDFLLCAGFSIALPIGQVMFKWAAVYSERLQGPLWLRLATNYPLICAFAWYAATALVWFYILTRVPLSLAYACSVLGSGLVPLMAWLVFKEQLSWQFAAGYLLMLAGFAVVMLGKGA